MYGFLASMLSWVIAIGMLWGATCAGIYTAHATSKSWMGWAVGILLYATLLVALSPVSDMIDHAICYGWPDYQTCVRAAHGID